MCNCKHCHCSSINLVEDGIREVTKDVTPDLILILRPHQRVGVKAVNPFKCLGSKGIRSNGAALKVPEECLAYLCLCVRQNIDHKQAHRALSLALASAHGPALTAPDRSAARRAVSSCRQASEIAESSLPSRLSSKATTTADRSSVGSPRASSKMWSTRAFINQSLALQPLLVTVRAEPAPNSNGTYFGIAAIADARKRLIAKGGD